MNEMGTVVESSMEGAVRGEETMVENGGKVALGLAEVERGGEAVLAEVETAEEEIGAETALAEVENGASDFCFKLEWPGSRWTGLRKLKKCRKWASRQKPGNRNIEKHEAEN